MSRPLRILFVPFGSEGDVNPLVWLARGMQARGHEPVFLITPHYARRVEGMEWHPIGTEEDFFRMARDPDLWRPVKGTFRVAAAMTESLDAYRAAFARFPTRFDLVVTTSFSFGASCLAESAGIPRLLLHLQPVCMRSVADFPVMGDGLGWFRRAPQWMKHTIFGVTDSLLDAKLLPPLNRFRAQLGLPPWKRFYGEALMAAEGIALPFPEWFAPPQPEWPRHVRQFGFPDADPAAFQLPQALDEWLKDGPPPLVWTHGSANLHTVDFHRLAVDVSREAGARALLVGMTDPSLPDSRDILHCPHVPFETLFPRCRAVVHHAGIGTTAKAFAAGIPQIAMPLAHDQFDNAWRIAHLGAGVRARKNRRSAMRAVRAALDGNFDAGVARCRELMRNGSGLSGLCGYAGEIASGQGRDLEA